MATLIAQYNSEGCVRRCDARCHNATGKTCECICGGANHGAGERQAVENTREMIETLVAEAGYRINTNAVAQLALPGLEEAA